MAQGEEFKAMVCEFRRSGTGKVTIQEAWLLSESGDGAVQLQPCPIDWNGQASGESGTMELPGGGSGPVKVLGHEIQLDVACRGSPRELLRIPLDRMKRESE
jgi:hypothetical protein